MPTLKELAATAEATKKKAPGIPLSKNDPAAAPLPPESPEQRELGCIKPGERIPMDYPTDPTNKKDHAWFVACHSFSTDLGLVVEEPESRDLQPTHAWLAIHCQQFPGRPLLLHRLPILYYTTPINDPF